MSIDFLDGCFQLLEHSILTNEQQAVQIQSFLHNQIPLLTTEQIQSLFTSLPLSSFLLQWLFSHLLPFSHNNHFLTALLLTKSSRSLECSNFDQPSDLSTPNQPMQSNETEWPILWRIPSPSPLSALLQRTADAVKNDTISCLPCLFSFYLTLVAQEWDSPQLHEAISRTLRSATQEECTGFIGTLAAWTSTHANNAALHALREAVGYLPAKGDLSLYVRLLALLHQDGVASWEEQPTMVEAVLGAVFVTCRLPDQLEPFLHGVASARPDDAEAAEVFAAWVKYASLREEKALSEAVQVEETARVESRCCCGLSCPARRRTCWRRCALWTEACRSFSRSRRSLPKRRSGCVWFPSLKVRSDLHLFSLVSPRLLHRQGRRSDSVQSACSSPVQLGSPLVSSFSLFAAASRVAARPNRCASRLFIASLLIFRRFILPSKVLGSVFHSPGRELLLSWSSVRAEARQGANGPIRRDGLDRGVLHEGQVGADSVQTAAMEHI